MIGDLDGEGLQFGLAALAVGKARGVAEIEVILAGQRHEQLVQHGEAADARVEHGHGELRGSGHGDHGVKGRGGAAGRRAESWNHL